MWLARTLQQHLNLPRLAQELFDEGLPAEQVCIATHRVTAAATHTHSPFQLTQLHAPQHCS